MDATRWAASTTDPKGEYWNSFHDVVLRRVAYYAAAESEHSKNRIGPLLLWADRGTFAANLYADSISRKRLGDTHMSDLTVGIYPRERFSLYARCISALIRNTKIPFKLKIVDCCIPDRYRRLIDREAKAAADVEVIEADEFLLPNQSRNLIMNSSETDFVCFLEADVLIQEESLQCMLETARASSAAVIRPTIYQRRGVVHFDRALGPISDATGEPGSRAYIGDTTDPTEYELGSHSRPVQWSEFHCILLRREAMTNVFPLDDELSEPEHVDFSLRLRAARALIVYEPSATVRLLSPPPVRRDELDYYRFRWDAEKASLSHKRFRERWNLDYRGLEEWIATAVPARESRLKYGQLRWRKWLSEITSNRWYTKA